ncbi:MAG: hypothetical protein MH252_04730, partial [Thermosynechococcaceae cyanobacterium MS004]|nr:hypothetical protein [Thermosynechococcaceae cyanobacterium MS004]
MVLLTPKAKSTSRKDNNSKKGGNKSELYNRLASYQSSQNRWIPLTIIGLLALNILSQCSIKNEIHTVQRQEKYAFLQKADGSTERIEQVNSTDRSIPILKKFAYDWTKT